MKSVKYGQRKAFSMLELIFVIVILGIVASIGAEIIAKVYDSYILERAQHRASVKTELAATQIANRLAYAIRGTVYRKSTESGAALEEINDPLGYPLKPDTYYLLQWVGYDADSFGAITSDTDKLPGWSGFCDLNVSTGSTVSTPGSKLSLAHDIIQNLSNNAEDVDSAKLYFVGYEDNESNITGYDTSTTPNTLTLTPPPSRKVEQYKLAWTSYALVVDSNNSLYLYHNFSAVPKAALPSSPTTSQRSLLLDHITTFKFRGDGQTIRFKICTSENIGEDFNVTSCKEKAVF
jgi:prepilin-type N-terminal cleavage/methylation domain-containing protein